MKFIYDDNDDENIDIELEQYGCSFFPLFIDKSNHLLNIENNHDIYGVSGIFQNIIFEGEINDRILNEIMEIGPKQFIKNECALTKQQKKEKKLIPKKNYQSIFVRIY